MTAVDRVTFKCNICPKSCFEISLRCFSCYMLLSELAKGFWNFNASHLNWSHEALVQKEALTISLLLTISSSDITMDYSRKILNTESWGYTFFKWSLQFRPWKFYKTVLDPLEIPRSKIKTMVKNLLNIPENSVYLLNDLWSFHLSIRLSTFAYVFSKLAH